MEAFTRLIELLAALESAPVRTGEELAARLGVTLRTVRRDIGRLRDAGYQIDAAPGVYGGYRLAGGTRLPPLVLTDDEAIAVAIALRGTATATVGGVDAGAALDALGKVEQLLPAGLRQRVGDLRDATTSLLRTPAVPADADTLLAIARACRQLVRIAFDYTDTTSRTRAREVEPFRLVQTSHCWYLVARDVSRSAWRTYRVDRITDIALTTHPFQHRDPPDAERFVTEGMAVATYRRTARLRIPVPRESALDVIPKSYAVIDAIDDGSCMATIGFEHDAWLVMFVARLPWDVDVIEPDSVRSALAHLGARLVSQHARSAPSPA